MRSLGIEDGLRMDTQCFINVWAAITALELSRRTKYGLYNSESVWDAKTNTSTKLWVCTQIYRMTIRVEVRLRTCENSNVQYNRWDWLKQQTKLVATFSLWKIGKIKMSQRAVYSLTKGWRGLSDKTQFFVTPDSGLTVINPTDRIRSMLNSPPSWVIHMDL